MHRIITLFRLSIKDLFIYKANFILWRTRSVLQLFVVYFLWSALYQQRKVILSYTNEAIMTYIFFITIAGTIVLTTRTTDIAGLILKGDIAHYIIKPYSIFRLFLIREAAEKFINMISVLIEVGLIILIFSPHVVIQRDIFIYIIVLFFIFFGILISFFLSLILSLVAFWTAEVWAPRFVYFAIIGFLAGGYFPLDVLPGPIYKVIMITPFPYLYYTAAITYVRGFSSETLLFVFFAFCWTVLLFLITKRLWHKGMREFSFYGK